MVFNFLNFEEQAVKLSQDPSVSINRGKITTSRGDLLPAYERAAYSLNVGEISPPVLTKYGYHLIKLLDSSGLAPS